MKLLVASSIAATWAVFAQQEVDSKENGDIDEDDLEALAGHVHYVDPSMDGSCVACVGARRIYCMDGGREEVGGDIWDSKLGSCQPNYSYCTEAGRK